MPNCMLHLWFSLDINNYFVNLVQLHCGPMQLNMLVANKISQIGSVEKSHQAITLSGRTNLNLKPNK